jgi:hypothetical protein
MLSAKYKDREPICKIQYQQWIYKEIGKTISLQIAWKNKIPRDKLHEGRERSIQQKQ